jgi:hypothetical protein
MGLEPSYFAGGRNEVHDWATISDTVWWFSAAGLSSTKFLWFQRYAPAIVPYMKVYELSLPEECK